jgi:hypothetical protein
MALARAAGKLVTLASAAQGPGMRRLSLFCRFVVILQRHSPATILEPLNSCSGAADALYRAWTMHLVRCRAVTSANRMCLGVHVLVPASARASAFVVYSMPACRRESAGQPSIHVSNPRVVAIAAVQRTRR